MTASLRRNLIEVFNLPISAVDWLCGLFDAIQVFDDLNDKDKEVSKEALHGLIWSTLVSLPQNQFFRTHQDALWPLLAGAIMKWHGSNTVEEASVPDSMSFVWRAGYYDIVLMAVGIVHGHKFASDNAHLVMGLYGESFEDYKKEFGNA